MHQLKRLTGVPMASTDDSIARDEIKMLTFSLDNVFYGVDVNQVREVKNFESATPVPYAPHYVKGVTNFRGEVVPVIDLRKRIGLSDKKEKEDTPIMVIIQDKHPIGVIVDSVIEVLTLQKKDIETGPESLLTDRSDGVIGIAKHDQDLIVLLDIIKVLSNDNLGNIKENIKGFQIQVNNAKK
jgi:purine-binding chemotaxis protein CheW